MQFIKKNLLSATLFSIVAFILILIAISSGKDDNSSIQKKAKLELVQESEWLSPLSSSIPVSERKAIMDKLKAGGWLSTKKLPTGEYEIYSENGKRKALVRFFGDERAEDLIEVTILDSASGVVWKDTVGRKIILSNDGVHFTADYSTGALISFYNIKMGHSPLFTTGEPYEAYKFSEDGQYFVAVGRSLDFYTADGKLLWRKSTGTTARKLLALSDNLSRIAVVSNTAVFNDNPPEFKDVDLSQPLEKKGFEPSKEQSRKSHLTYLDKNGKVISQMELDYQVIEGIVFLPNEPNLILIDARINLLLVDGQAKSIIWKYPEDINPLYQITNIDFSKEGTLIALGVISDVNRKESPRYAILLNKNGELLQKIEIKDTYKSQLGGPMVFLGEKEYLLVRSQNQMWVYKISYPD